MKRREERAYLKKHNNSSTHGNSVLGSSIHSMKGILSRSNHGTGVHSSSNHGSILHERIGVIRGIESLDMVNNDASVFPSEAADTDDGVQWNENDNNGNGSSDIEP